MESIAPDGFDAINVVNQYFQFIDARDFTGTRGLLADELTVDYGGINPDSEGTVTADDLERSWRQLLEPIALTQHMVTTPAVTVDGEEATVSFHLEALHHHPDLGDDENINTWTMYGRGEIRLHRSPDGWKVIAERLVAVHNTGNVDLLSDIIELGSTGLVAG